MLINITIEKNFYHQAFAHFQSRKEHDQLTGHYNHHSTRVYS